MKILGEIGFVCGVASLILWVFVAFFKPYAVEDHTHDPTGVQIGSTICLEFGTLHYPDPLGVDAHIPAAFCGEVVGEEERVPVLGENTHLAQ